MSRILLLEDDIKMGTQLNETLQSKSYSVDWAQDLATAKRLSEQNLPDLYLLDWNLPDGTGYDWALEIRQYDEEVPIIFLTAQIDEESAVAALRAGANDYIRKPFGRAELFIRIQKALKESMQPKDELRFGDLIIERSQRIAFYKDVQLPFNKKEFELFEMLMKKAPSVVSREELWSNLSKSEDFTVRIVDSQISHIRKKLKDANVVGVKISASHAIGYKMEKDE